MDVGPSCSRTAAVRPIANQFRAGCSRRGSARTNVRVPLAFDFGQGPQVTPLGPPEISGPSFALCLLLILLIPCASAGLALINAGLGRFRNAAHSMTSALCVIAVAAAAYFFVGAAWQGYAGQPAYALHAAGRDWNWIGAQRFFLRGVES